jgi:nitrogen fixation/metabolism regulation signal transduction histidine kinase
MTSDDLFSEGYLRSLFDAFPSPVLVCDRTMVIQDANSAAKELVGDGSIMTLRRLCGNALLCVHALAAVDGCGTSEFCGDCVLRQTVEAVGSGHRRHRRVTEMKLERAGKVRDAWFMVSGHPFDYDGQQLVVITLEEVTELVELRRIVPICSHCRKVRDDADFWHQVEDYFRKHTGLQFSHGICPECLREHYPELTEAAGGSSPGEGP